MSSASLHHPLIPGFILENYAARQMRGAFSAAGMFVDISGFSSMTDALMEHGPHGAETLAGLMRASFSPLMRVVFERGGLIVNQAGDSFTALFPFEENNAPARALTAAWEIQELAHSRPTFDTPYGTFAISVKIGLALGDCAWEILESAAGDRAVYYFRGTVIDRCAEAEHLAAPGEILLNESICTVTENFIDAESRGEAYRLLSMRGELSKDKIELPRSQNNLDRFSHDLARRFYPESVLASAMNGEFRQVVSLFISLPTVRTETQLMILMETFFKLQERYGGLLSRLSFGDKGAHLFIFWGAPVAYENDLQRAFHFILELQALTEIPIHGGVTYRMAHVGYIGGDLAEEYTGYGRGTNLAARFMTAAARGEIWVDEPAARLAGGSFAFAPLGRKSIKGFGQPQEVYLLLERKEEVEPVYEGDMVGREKELEALRRFVHPIFSGEYGGALVVWGEPGMGKSRLVYDFQARLKGAQLFLGQCDEILRQSLNPFRYWLMHYFDQSVEQSDGRNKRNFNRRLDELVALTRAAALAAELDRTRSCLGALVGLEWPDSLYQQLDAQGRFENTLLGLAALLQAESRRAPLIFFLEDAHWLDEDSQYFLPRLLKALSGAPSPFPVAIIATARFEGAGLPLETFPYQEIRLGALNEADLAVLAAAHLGEPAGADLLNLLAERSEGNPYFAGQMLRYLQEAGWLVRRDGIWQISPEKRQEAPLPENVQAVLVARLDRLAEEVRRVVQTAAVLGREFEIRLLAEMLREDDRLADKVRQAEQAAVWSALNELRYIFRHALMRDAAYQTQLRARRQALHALALEALERLYLDESASSGDPGVAGRLAPRYGELAYHAEQASLGEKALGYLVKAGDAARDAYQNPSALDYYTRALAFTGAETDGAKLRYLYIERSRVLERTGRFEQALADHKTLQALAQERGDHAMELAALLARSVILSIETSVQDRPLGMQVARQALELARALGDRASEAQALENLALAGIFLTQDPGQSIPYYEQSIAIARELGRREQLAHALIGSAGIYIFALGAFETGQARAAEGIALCRELGKPYQTTEALQASGLGYFLAGDFHQAIGQLEAADQLNKTIGSAWGRTMCSSILGSIAWEQGKFSRALRQMETAIRLGDESGYLMGRIMGRGLLGLFYAMLGRIPAAIELCRQALDLSQSKGLAFQAQVLASLAWIYILQGDQPQAEETIRQAWQSLQQRISYPIEPNFVAVVDGYVALAAGDGPRLRESAERARGMLERTHNRIFATDAAYLLGQALLLQGQPAEAAGILKQALADAQEIGSRRTLWPILFSLAKIGQAGALERARAIVREIAGEIAEPEGREGFLGQVSAGW